MIRSHRRPARLAAAAILAACAASAAPSFAQPSAAPGFAPEPSPSRPPAAMSGADIRQALGRLQVLGTALYVAAHPDDENTALLSYFVGERKVRTGYLSMTRGDGGQNLIGAEAGDPLGVIRTQELLSARHIDHAEQFFTRAVDFGYSKTTDEALAFWGHDEVLSDVVRVIRAFRPDVIITRFTPERGGHGHHTASALLASEAFEAAADPKRFPEHGLPPWRAKRLMWNVFSFRGVDPGEAKGVRVEVDLGAYNPVLGRAYTEIAGESRSMHKSQGFGAPERRGAQPQWLEQVAGDPPTNDAFDGVNLGWSRLKGGDGIANILRDAAVHFDERRPAAIVPTLLAARAGLDRLGDDPWIAIKRGEIDDLVRACTGLWLEAIAAPTGSPGDTVALELSALNRSDVAVTLERIELPHGAVARAAAKDAPPGELRDRVLAVNAALDASANVLLPAHAPVTGPYWLAQPSAPGRYVVSDATLLGRPESPPALSARFHLNIAGTRIAYDVPVLHRWVDRVEGERYRRFQIVPPVSMRFEDPVLLFTGPGARDVSVLVRAHRHGAAGSVSLAAPTGWTLEPASRPFALAAEGDETTLRFRLTPPAAAPAAGGLAATLAARATVGGREWSLGWQAIDYAHVPREDLFPPAACKLVRATLAKRGATVGYVMGSGDEGPRALRQAGYQVNLLSDDDVAAGALSAYDAIVVGVRAYNTRPRLKALQPQLVAYVHGGGTLVTQFNTSEPDLGNRVGPYSLSISRDRVTAESAEVRFVRANHPLLTTPNRISAEDFRGWVQERGVYFPNEWDRAFEPVLSSNDLGEPALEGGLLYARHGKGIFIYTGYAFFRQLPAGVPGAYRLFVNLVSARQ